MQAIDKEIHRAEEALVKLDLSRDRQTQKNCANNETRYYENIEIQKLKITLISVLLVGQKLRERERERESSSEML